MTNGVELVMMRQWESHQSGVLSLWTVFDHPRDFPDAFVARRFETGNGHTEPFATADVLAAVNLETLRDCFRMAGLVVMQRDETDDAKIVETWL